MVTERSERREEEQFECGSGCIFFLGSDVYHQGSNPEKVNEIYPRITGTCRKANPTLVGVVQGDKETHNEESRKGSIHIITATDADPDEERGYQQNMEKIDDDVRVHF